jgi:hypothetical protein
VGDLNVLLTRSSTSGCFELFRAMDTKVCAHVLGWMDGSQLSAGSISASSGDILHTCPTSTVNGIHLALHRPGTWSNMLFDDAQQLSSTVRRLRRGPLTDSRLFPSLGSWTDEWDQPNR